MKTYLISSFLTIFLLFFVLTNLGNATDSTSFLPTQNHYADSSDQNLDCKAEFGSGAIATDWVMIKERFTTDEQLVEWLDSIVSAGFWVVNNGDSFWNGTDRRYFIGRHDHNKPSHFLAHDDLFNYRLSLGSWYGEGPSLCEVPDTNIGKTTTTLSIREGATSIFTPSSIDFGELEVSSSEQTIDIELEAPNYFGLEDLSGQGGYYTTLQIGELSDGDKELEVTEAKVRVENGTVYIIAGQENSDIYVPESVRDFIAFDGGNPANIFERASTKSGRIGKYGILPHMRLTIPAYQQVGDYEGTITFTIIDDASDNSIVYTSCKELLDNIPNIISGNYRINPSGNEEFEVYCDMDTNGGGWTLVQNLNSGKISSSLERDVNNYKEKFYSLNKSQFVSIDFSEVLDKYFSSSGELLASSKNSDLNELSFGGYEKQNSNNTVILKSHEKFSNENTLLILLENNQNNIVYEPLLLCNGKTGYYQYFSSLDIPYFSTYSGCRGSSNIALATRINDDGKYNYIENASYANIWIR